MILLLGDIHGDYRILQRAVIKANELGATALIQVGDFGLFPGNEASFYQVCQSDVPVYFVDGNHDDCSRWQNYDNVSKVFGNSNLYYVPRGSVFELDDMTIAFMGGAGSIDKHIRLREGMHWDENENISPIEVLRMMDNAKDKNVHTLITHCPPNSVIQQHFDNRAKLHFGVGLDWHDHNQDVIENIWRELGYPKIYSGHMHRTVVEKNYRILDINELIEI